MPVEYALLKNAPVWFKTCPDCEAPFEPFLRGLVQRSPIGWRWGWPPWYQRPYCALICWACKEIIGWE